MFIAESGTCRSFCIAAAVVLLAAAAGAAAQAFPAKPVEFVVHSGAGGGPDVFVRAVSEIMTHERIFSQPLTVSNRTGGGGSIAFNYVKSKRGDPHVILGVGTGTLLTMAARPDLEYGLENYTPLAFFALDAQVIAVAADSKFKTFKDLIDAGRRDPNAISCAVASATGFGRVVLYMMERDTGARFKYVSFKSGTEAALAVVGGHVPFTTENVSETAALVEGKKLRVLAVTGDKRMAAAPDAPTLKELGYPLTIGTGRGFAMPAGVPKDAATTMETALKKVHDSAAWQDFATRNMYEDTYLGGAEFAQYLVKHREEMRQFLVAIGLVPKP
jgi:tripartite-type tricarboxylate transporter receptor subunit TctC